MLKTSIGAALSAFVIAGLFGVAGIGGASAESVMKQCGDDWKAAKAAGTTNGQTWKDFLKTCRAQKEAAAPAATPEPAAAPAPAPTPVAAPTPKPTPVAAPMKPAPVKPTPKPSVAASGAGEFASEGEAKAKCPTDTVVWVNTKSHKYHFAGHHSYGKTKQGAYMCQADADTAGDIAAKGEKPKP